jgi:hypothetical protein
MDKKIEAEFIEAFPTLFKNMYGDPKETCMAWGIDCGIGWKEIIWNLCTKIKEEIEKDETAKGFHFDQIKEKFGGLRLYSRNANDAIYQLINETENDSFRVCEECGSRANVSTEGRPHWITTLCSQCAK